MHKGHVLITGSNGFLGGALASYLRRMGYRITGLGRKTQPSRRDVVDHYVSVDLSNPSGVMRVMAALEGVNCIFHCAGLTSARQSFDDPALYYSVNVGGFANLLLAAKTTHLASSRVIAISSGAVYGGELTTSASEETVPRPIGPYAETKFATERLLMHEVARGSIASGTTLRVFGISGSINGFVDREPSRLLPSLMLAATGRKSLFRVNGDGSAIREFLDIRDFVVACERAIAVNELEHSAINIGGGISLSIRDAISLVQLVSGREILTVYGNEVNEQRVITANNSRALSELGWKPTKLDPLEIVGNAWHAFCHAEPTE